MFKKVMVPLDGSLFAERALPYAESLARASASPLLLVRAVLVSSLIQIDPAEGQVAAIDEAVEYLARVSAGLTGRGVKVETAVPYGRAADAIITETEIHPADLVVMSTHGRGGLGRWVYGSVADEVLRRATGPVLMIPAAADPAWPTGRALRILVPLDGSALAAEAVGPACALADALPAELVLLQVAEPPDYGLQAETHLGDVARDLRAAGRIVDVHSIVGQPAIAVAAAAREFGADVIAMATHGRGGLSRLVMGSVAAGTLQRTSVPLLLVRPAAVRRAATEAAAKAAGSAARNGSPIVLTLDPAEVGLVEQGLEQLLYSPERNPRLDQALSNLLGRLRGAAPAEVDTAVNR